MGLDIFIHINLLASITLQPLTLRKFWLMMDGSGILFKNILESCADVCLVGICLTSSHFLGDIKKKKEGHLLPTNTSWTKVITCEVAVQAMGNDPQVNHTQTCPQGSEPRRHSLEMCWNEGAREGIPRELRGQTREAEKCLRETRIQALRWGGVEGKTVIHRW